VRFDNNKYTVAANAVGRPVESQRANEAFVSSLMAHDRADQWQIAAHERRKALEAKIGPSGPLQ
jgi:hypothetical protein